jgi:hypothetical protein
MLDLDTAAVQVLERMQEVEVPGGAGEDGVERPGAELLVGRHVSDILKPDVYLGGDKAFVAYVNNRINVRPPVSMTCSPFVRTVGILGSLVTQPRDVGKGVPVLEKKPEPQK